MDSCMDQLITGLSSCLLTICSKLVAENLISADLMEEMLIPTTGTEKSAKLVLHIRKQVKISPHNFATFLTVIREEPTLKILEDVLTQKYSK